jgi:hypothetical protein
MHTLWNNRGDPQYEGSWCNTQGHASFCTPGPDTLRVASWRAPALTGGPHEGGRLRLYDRIHMGLKLLRANPFIAKKPPS